MQKTRKIALVGASLAVALGSGYMMQSRSTAQLAENKAEAPREIIELAATATPVLVEVDIAPAVPEVVAEPAPVVTAAVTEPVVLPPSPPVAALPEPAPATVAEAEAVADPCPVTFLATPAEGALIDITLLAACTPSERVVLQHGGLAFTARTSANGAVFATIPAMEPAGRVTLRFEDGTTHEADAATDLTGIRRFAVQWVAADAFQLQAYENGAAYGTSGHVSAATPRLPAPGEAFSGGYLMQLGDASVTLPMLAEVYTWPASEGASAEVAIEAAVTEATCNREILGEALESRDGRVSTDEITLAMPTCDAVGDFLVLNNLAPGTTLAAAE